MERTTIRGTQLNPIQSNAPKKLLLAEDFLSTRGKINLFANINEDLKVIYHPLKF
jgi:hypothetical protein